MFHSARVTDEVLAEARAAVARRQKLVDEMRVLRAEVKQQADSLCESAAALRATMALAPHHETARVPPSEGRTRTVDPKDAERLNLLTPREMEVLRMIGEGHRTKEIAFQLGITFKTAVTHRSNIMEKLGIHEGPRLVRFAIRTGICDA